MIVQFIAEPLSTDKICEIAFNLRCALGFNKELYFPIVHFVELVLPQIDDEFSFVVEEEGKMPDKYAYYDYVKNEMVVRNDVYCLACAENGRHRFTIAHELGHYILHRNGVKMCRIAEKESIAAYLDPEWQANTFASAILMPKRLISGLTANEISIKCSTSLQAAEIAYKKAKKPS